MQKHTNRLIVAAVLIAAGVIGGFFVFAAHRRAAGIDAAADDVTRRVERMIATAGDIAAAQQAYVAPGQPDQPWLERSAMLLQRFGQDAAAIRPLLQSNDAAATLDEVEKDFKAIVVIDGKARQDLQQAQNLLAADLIFGEGHDTIAALVMTLRGLESSEEQTAAVERASLERQQWGGLILVALVWVVGLMVLVPMASTVAPAHPEPLNLEPSNLEPPNHQVPATVDLAATADVCGALARTTNTASLRDALARSASVLDARGIIVWMGAGEELFPALWFGYDERIVQRLGPIARNAANATAEAWRTAQLRTVSADVMSHGAVAVPITGVSGCVGVFAAEVRNGREEDPATRAVAAILAAQLAGIVSAWPAGSATEVPKTA
ncbi:MAG: hypothetical protein DMF87_24490 [Acidobacteria bacterium]|nr:MAG: hypothetical protein DMF87_24490 [Acidobacteriota bacterium]